MPLRQKTKTLKKKQYCNKFNKYLKIIHIRKKILKKKGESGKGYMDFLVLLLYFSNSSENVKLLSFFFLVKLLSNKKSKSKNKTSADNVPLVGMLLTLPTCGPRPDRLAHAAPPSLSPQGTPPRSPT